ncbi:putative transferase [Helianthus anomalus]
MSDCKRMRFCVSNNKTYIVTGHMMNDIYGFGVLLIEILTALPAIGENTPNEQHSLVEWARQILANKRNLKEIIDPRLEQNYPLESAFECGGTRNKMCCEQTER